MESAHSLNSKYLLETFVVGLSNQLAHAAGCAVTCDVGTLYNPLLITGEHGMGKTHLLHAIGNEILRRCPILRTCYVSCEGFVTEALNSIACDKLRDYFDGLGSFDVLLVDDMHILLNKPLFQASLKGIVEKLIARDKQVCLSATVLNERTRKMVTWIAGSHDKLFTAAIESPDLETIDAILKFRLEKAGLFYNSNLIEIISRVYDRVRDIDLLGNVMVRLATLAKTKNTEMTDAEIELILENEIYYHDDSHMSAPRNVFISYAWADSEAVLAVDQWLRNRGSNVILDVRDLLYGEDIRDQIIEFIKTADAVVCFYSNNSKNRPYPKLERRLAEEWQLETEGQENQPRVIYFCLDDTPLPLYQKPRLAIKAKGKGFEEVCFELWRGIGGERGVPQERSLSHYYLWKPPW